MSVEEARATYAYLKDRWEIHASTCQAAEPRWLRCAFPERWWLETDAASIYLDLAAAMDDRERTLQLAGVDDASSNAPRQG